MEGVTLREEVARAQRLKRLLRRGYAEAEAVQIIEADSQLTTDELECADAAIAVIVERCAKVAESERLEEPQPDTSDEGYEQAITDIATAIRALTSTPNTP